MKNLLEHLRRLAQSTVTFGVAKGVVYLLRGV